ncbi:MAG TPA: SHOCT domain-containing protein [Roseimicrobium sp.]|nr:SHOCT domain-containing protein [Roseimicrobium sp.]
MLADGETGPILVGSVIVLVIAVVGFLGVKWISKWMKNQDDPTVGTGFTLSDLRQLHKSGKMSAEEFEKAKAILLATAAKPLMKPQSTEKKIL